MKTVWTNGLTSEQKAELRRDYEGSAILRERLKKILVDKTETSRKGSLSKEGYANPNWAYLQADARGYERALEEIISLIS